MVYVIAGMFHLERAGVAVEVAAAAGAGGGEESSEREGMELTSGLDRWGVIG